MRAVCVLEGSGEPIFTLNTETYDLRENDRIKVNSVIYKVESVLLEVTVLPDAVASGSEGAAPVILPGAERNWSTGKFYVTLSVVP